MKQSSPAPQQPVTQVGQLPPQLSHLAMGEAQSSGGGGDGDADGGGLGEADGGGAGAATRSLSQTDHAWSIVAASCGVIGGRPC